MLSDKEQRLLIRKKKYELLALGISPHMYFQVTKFLNRDYIFIIKNNIPHVFLNSKEVDDNDICRIVITVFSIKSQEAELIVCEWTRDRTLYHNMMNNQRLYYDYLMLPLPHNNNDYEGFNF